MSYPDALPYCLTIVTAETSDDGLWYIEQETGHLLAMFGAVDMHFSRPQAGRVLDIHFAQGVLEEMKGRLELYRESRRYDYVLQPSAARQKKLLLSDMDSTIIGQECIDELAAECGLRDKVAAITERAMRGELDFASALTERVALLQGLSVEVIERLLQERIQLNPGAELLVRTMRAHGAHCVLVSGGFTAFTQAIAERCGFHEHHANELEWAQGQLTGKVVPPILGQEAKLQQLHQQLLRLGLDAGQSLAIGDGANDIPMLSGAGLGVGYYAKPMVLDVVDADIRYTDLTTLLWAQGLRPAEIA